jgi:hypothetical protein
MPAPAPASADEQRRFQPFRAGYAFSRKRPKEAKLAKDHGPSVKNDKQYEGLRKKGMSKERAAKIANTPNASKKGGKKSGSKSS